MSADKREFTLFLCGRSRCEHEYTLDEPIIENGNVVGGTAVCHKCGARAIDEAMWY
jgi:hypothetical protein